MPRRLAPLLLLLASLSAPLTAAAETPEIASLRTKAEKGNAIAQYNLGLTYLAGQDVPADWAEAFVWLTLAAENGTTGKALQNLTEEMSAPQLAEGRRRLAALREALGKPAPAPVAAATDAQKDLSNELALAWKESDDLRAALAEAHRAREDAAAQVQQLSNELTELRRTATDLGSRNQEMEDAAVLRGRTLEETREKLAAAEARITALSASEADLRRTLAAAESGGTALAETQSSLEAARSELAAAKRSHADTLGELRRQEAALADLKAQLAASAAQAEAGSREVATLRTQLAQAQGAADSRATDEVASLQDELKRVRAELASLGVTHQQLEDTATSRGRQLEETRRALNQANERIAALATSEQALRRNLSDRNWNAGQLDDAAAQIADLRSQLQDAQARLADATAAQAATREEADVATAQLAQQQSLIEQQQARLVALRHELDGKQAELKRHADQIKTLQSSLADAGSAASASAHAAGEVAALRTEAADLHQQIEAANKATDETNRQLAALSTDLGAARVQLVRAQSQNEQLTAQLAAAATPAPADTGRLDALSRELASAQTRLAAAQTEAAKADTLTAQVADLQAALERAAAAPAAPAADDSVTAELEAKLSTTLRSYTLLQGENERLKAAANQRATEVATLQEQLAGAQASAAGALSEAESAATLQAELDTVRRSYTQLQEEADSLRAASSAQSEQIAALESALAAAPAHTADDGAAARVAALTAELQQTRTTLAEARAAPAPTADAAEVATLRQQLRVSVDQLNLARRENDALRTRLAVITPSPASSFATPTRPGSATAAAIQQTAPAPAPVAPPAAAARTHIVAPGDTLSALALRYYGSPVRWAEIFEANRDRLPNERALRPGMELVIP